MVDRTIIGELGQIRLTYASHRAYHSLAIVKKSSWIERQIAVQQIAKCSIAECNIAAFQSELSAITSMLWNLIYHWNLREHNDYKEVCIRLLDRLVIPKQLRKITTDVKPLSIKHFNLEPELLAMINNNSFHYYLGAKILNADFAPFSYQELEDKINLVKATDLNDDVAVSKSLKMLGKNDSIDMQGTWNQKFVDDRLN